jgi:6-phosphogluconolactonase (cycloisomerase 2 family)
MNVKPSKNVAQGRMRTAVGDSGVIIEQVEGRVMLSAGHGGPGKHATATVQDVVYVMSNNPTPGQNSILAYRRTAAGKLTPIGEFKTGGTGYYNGNERLGPDDSDQEIVATPDHKTLYAVNSGSNSVTSFKILTNGALQRTGVFNSGGVNPASIGLAGDNLYVVNKSNQDPGQTTGDNPNITGFNIKKDGALKAIPHGTVELAPGVQPTQALVSPDQKHLFTINLFENPITLPPGFPPFAPPYSSTIVSYDIRPNGRLVEVDRETNPGFPPYMLGLQAHPTAHVLYAGFLLNQTMGVYTYDKAGELTLVDQAATGPGDVGICWIEISKDGRFAYASNATTDTLSVFSLADPLHPTLLQSVALAGPKVPVPQPAPVLFSTTPFQLELDADDEYLYVVNHETTVDDSFPNGNAVHVLKVGADGRLTEVDTVLLTGIVPAGAHPKGVIAF